MATGSDFQPRRGRVLTDVTPGIDFLNGETEMLASVGRLADQITEAAKPGLKRRAEEAGAREGAEAAEQTNNGEAAETPHRGPLFFGEMAEAREDAARRAYQAKVRSDYDRRESEVQAEFSHDVEGYRRRMGEVRSTYIQNSPPEYAVDLEGYATSRIDMGVSAVAERAGRVRLAEEAATLSGRMDELGRQMADELAETGAPTVKYQILLGEYEDVRESRLQNPALPYTQTEADADTLELQVASKAALYTHHARNEFRQEGAVAALDGLQAILTDPDLGESERAVVFERVRATINREVDLATDQANLARSALTRAQEAMKQRIEDSAGAVEVGADDTGLTEGEVMAVLGASGVAEFHRKRAEAAERNRLTGQLIGLPPEEALRRARAALPGVVGTTLADLGKPLENPSAFDAFAAAIQQVETGNNPARISADPDGTGGAAGGAIGAMQLKPDTARAAAQRLGIPYDERRLLTDVAYNQQLGREELRHLLARYDGDAQLAATAYYAGPGLVDAWTQPVGTITRVNVNGEWKRVAGKGDPRTGDISFAQWIDAVDRAGNPLSAAYPRKVAEALAGGRAATEWRETQAQAIVTNATAGFASDPISFAAMHRLNAHITLPVDAVFAGGAETARWGEALRSRFALAGNLADQYQVPERILTNAEVATYRSRFARDPGAAVEFAEQATRFIGGQGARNALLEIGQGDAAPATIHIATLATAGGSARFADSAAQGLQLKAAGEKLSTERAEEIAEAIDRMRAPFASNAPLLQAIRATAEAAALADEAGGSAERRGADYYAQGAVGRTRWEGRSYGGVAEVNGRATLLPTWLNPDRAEDALERLAESWARTNTGPVYANDTPIPVRVVASLRMEMQPNGYYRLIDRDGRAAYGRSGRILEVNLEVHRPYLAARLGSAAVKPD